jgi:hypothetical protein
MLGCLLIGTVVGIGIYAQVGPNAITVPAATQVVLITLLTAGLGGGALLLSSAIAADVATAAAKAANESAQLDRDAAAAAAVLDREAAAQAHINEIKIAAFGEILQGGSRHAFELAQQVTVRIELSEGKDGLTIPDLHSTDPVNDALGSLYAFADQDTADAAQRLYDVLVELDAYAYDAAKHSHNGAVTGLEPSERQVVASKLAEFKTCRTALIVEIRRELKLPPLITRPFLPIGASSEVRQT